MSPENVAQRRPYGRPPIIALCAALIACTGWAASGHQAWSASAPDQRTPSTTATSVQTDPAVLDAFARNQTPAVIVRFRGKADLSAAAGIADRDAQGSYVYATLTRFAENAQRRTLSSLRSRHSLSEADGSMQVLWIANSIAIQSLTEAMLINLESSPDVESIRLQDTIPLPPDLMEPSAPPGPDAVIGSLARIKVPEVWALGYKGAGMVVANIDTGVLYNHEALVGKYRGTVSAGVYNHAYNWFDPYQHAATPRFTATHGSHTMGTIVGDNGAAEQIGGAPDAKWIQCLGFGGENGTATTAGLLACGQWLIAPTAPSGDPATANPALRPHVISNSWSACSASHDNFYDGMIEAWTAAGIASVFSNGNNTNCSYASNPPLGTVTSPASSGKTLAIGSTGTINGLYANHSNKGPSTDIAPGLPSYAETFGYPDLKPNLVAPGVAIRSSVSTSTTAYANNTGTSMSTPMVAGVIGLMLQSAPCLSGNVPRINTLLMESATRIARATGSPSDGPGNIPNQATGWGEVNALAAVNAAQAYCLNGATPSLKISFQPAKVLLNESSRLTISFSSYAAVPAQLTAAFSQTLPSALKIAPIPNAQTTCPSGVVTALPNSNSLILSVEAKIPAQGGSCTLSVDVQSNQDALHKTIIAPNTLQTNFGNNAYMAHATLQTGFIFPEPYCKAEYPNGSSPISRVRFGGIDNSSSPEQATQPELEDFTEIVETVVVGNTLRLRVEGNTDGEYLESITAFFDWNQNLIFDANERVSVGDLFDTTGLDGQVVEAQVTIPSDAVSGRTRMRVTKRYGGPSQACADAGWGQAEDYTLQVGPAGVTPTIAKSFSPSLLPTNGTSRLTVVLVNRHASEPAVLSEPMVDAFPAGLVIATPANASTTCTNGSVQAVPGDSSLSLSGPVSIAAESSCTVQADVASINAATHYNAIPIAALKTSRGNNAVAATATVKFGYSFPEPYCAPKFYRGVTPITRVKFDTIDNHTSASQFTEPALENFTAMTATVVPGGYLPLRVEGREEGLYATVITAFFDWNQNDVFDADERVDVGSFLGSTGTDGKNATTAVAVPLNARLGLTRMRVMKNLISGLDACDVANNGWGQGEDYSVNVIAGSAPPRVAMELIPMMNLVNAPTTARITLANVNNTPATLTSALVNTLPLGLEVTSVSTTCAGTVNHSGDRITLTSGSSIPADGNCMITASLRSAIAGNYTNLIDVGDLKTDKGNNLTPASATFRVSASYTFPEPYCGVDFQFSVNPITRVEFAGLINESPATSTLPLENFQSVTGARVSVGGSYALRVKAQTLDTNNPNVTNRIAAYFDWNQDGVFATEEGYLVGHLQLSTGLDDQFVSRNISVPTGTSAGTTRMRVMNMYNNYPTPCLQAGAGQAEDYTITIDSLSPHPVASISAPALDLAAIEGGSASGGLTIQNSAVAALDFDIDAALAAQARNLLISKSAAAQRALEIADGNLPGRISRQAAISTSPTSNAFVLGDAQISQMLNNTPSSGQGVACTLGDQASADNSWWRRFYFNEHPQVGAITQINAVTVASEVGPQIPVTINVYRIAHSVPVDTIPTAALTLIGTGSGTVGGSLSTSTIALYNTIVVDTSTHDLVVEYHIDGSPLARFLPGANNTAQTHRTFLSSAACGLTQPVTTESLGIEGGHLIMVLNVSPVRDPALGCEAPSVLPWLGISPSSGRIDGAGSLPITVNANSADLPAGVHRSLLCINTNDPVQPRFEVPVTFTVTPLGRIFANGFDAAEDDQPMRDPNFGETIHIGGGNPNWQGRDSNAVGNATPFYPASAFASQVRVQEGAAWLGGWGAPAGSQVFSQEVRLAKGKAKYLHYRRNALVAPTGTATLKVYVDAQLVDVTNLAANGVDAGWTRQSLNIERYADGGNHTIRFEYVSAGGVDGSVLIDGVTIGSNQLQ